MAKTTRYVVDSECDCQNIVVLVEDTLFTVIRGVFADSVVFQDMFSVPPPANVPVDGSSQEHPLKLEGVTKVDFKNFQGLFLPIGRQSHCPAAGALVQNKEAWVSALRLADRWQMNILREDAILKLTTLVTDPAEKVELSTTFDVPTWMLSALMALVNRDAHLSKDDIGKIGVELCVKIIAARESRFRNALRDAFRRSLCECTQTDDEDIICDTCLQGDTSLSVFEGLLKEAEIRVMFDL